MVDGQWWKDRELSAISHEPWPSALSHYWIYELADTLDRDGDRVSWRNRSDAFGRAGGDDIARLERHHERDELDQVLDRENQVTRARRLAALSVDEAFDAARLAVQPDRDARPDWRKGVEPLAARVLRLLLLQIARGDVVDADQAAHVVPRVLRGDAMRAPADDDAELRLVIDAADAGGNANRIPGTDHRARRLDEQERLRRQRLAPFTRVILVVESDADHLPGHHPRPQSQGRT